MLTPIDIQNHSLKTAVRGYSKRETDDFLEEILKGYEELYKENRELKDKITSLSEGIQYYKQMETTLQKALVLAEKTSSETQEAAKSRADSLTSEAQAKADAILKEARTEAEAMRKEIQAYSDVTKSKANHELEDTRNHVRKLVQSYENYRLQFKKLAESQIEMLESGHYSIFAPELSEMLDGAPDADAVMDAEKIIPINAKEDYYEKDSTVKEETAPEEPVEERKEETLPIEKPLQEEELPVRAEEPSVREEDIPEAVMETSAVTQDVPVEEPVPQKPVWEEPAPVEEQHDEAAETTETVSDALSGISEEEERARAKIKIPDMEITADTIVPGVIPPEKMKAVSQDTPKLDDYDQIEISKTVSPSKKEESPFVFIDTD